jgi:hypothetical protein
MAETESSRGRSLLQRVRPKEIAVVAGALLAWGLLFVAGFVINSGPFRDALTSGAVLTGLQRLKYWFIILTTFTLTNVAILCCLAAVIGAAGRRLRLGLTDDDFGRLDETPNLYAAAVVAGFFVYLVAISGVLVLVEQPFSALSPDRYTRLAGLISLLSFLAGYSPKMLAQFLGRIAEMIEGVGKQTPS